MTPPVATPRPDLTEAEFWELFRSGEPIERCRVTEDVDIRNSGLPASDAGAYVVSHPVDIKSGVVFAGKVYFENAIFERSVSLQGVKFARYANFAVTAFRDTSAFYNSCFHRGVTFQKTVFHGTAYFQGATFRGNSCWTWSRFHDDASFARVTFAGELPLRSCDEDINADLDCDGVASFVSADFARPADFGGVRYWPDSLGQWCLYRLRCLFWRQRVCGIRSMRFGPASRRAAKAYWWLRDLLWLGASRPGLDIQYEPRWLTRMYRRRGRYPDGPPGLGTAFAIDPQHISEVTNPQLRRYVANQQAVRAARSPHPRLATMWRYAGDYTRSATVLAMQVLIVLLVPAWAYTSHSDWALAPLGMNPVLEGSPLGWVDAVYFSAATLSTLGFGDITPLNAAGKVWVVGHVFAGYMTLGLLLSVVASHVLRRS